MTEYFGMTILDWIVVFFYMALVVVLGTLAYRKVKDMSDFFMGGRRFGKVFMMFFAFGAGTSSEQAVSVVAGTWRAGLAGIWWQFMWLWATPFYWIVAPILRRTRALTTSDFFQARYGPSTAMLYSVFGILFAIAMIASTLFSGGKMVDALTGGGLSYSFAVGAMTVMFVAYGMAGGLGAAIITDFIQGILTVVLSFMLLPWVFQKIGGFEVLSSGGEIKEGMFDLFGRPEVAELLGKEPITPFYVAMLSLGVLTGIVVQPHIMGVCGAGKTEFEGRFGFTMGNFIKRFCTIAWTFIGLACIVWYLSPELGAPIDSELRGELTQVISPGFDGLPADEQTRLKVVDKDWADKLFGRAAHDILPGVAPGLLGLLLASLLAAIMSTCDAQMIVASGLFTENIYKRFIAGERTQKEYVQIGRLAALGIVALALVFQLVFDDVIHALKVLIKTPAAIGISLWMGVIWRGWTSAAVWASSISAYVIWALTAWFPGLFDAIGLDFILNSDGTVNTGWSIFLYIFGGLGIGFVVSVFSQRPDIAKLDYFFRLMRTPVREGEIVKGPCMLPEDPREPIGKLFEGTEIEIPKFNRLDLVGFGAAWCMVAFIIGLTWWLSRPS